MTTEILTDKKNQSKTKTYCCNIAQLCFSLTLVENGVQTGKISCPNAIVPDTIPATVLILNMYDSRNAAQLECIL